MAATRIQRAYRGQAARDGQMWLEAATLMVQSVFRGQRTRRENRKRNVAVAAMQRVARGRKMRAEHSELLELAGRGRLAAATMQRLFRLRKEEQQLRMQTRGRRMQRAATSAAMAAVSDTRPAVWQEHELGGQVQTLVVSCPDGVVAGQILIMTTPSGHEIEVPVPEGVAAGDEFEVEFDERAWPAAGDEYRQSRVREWLGNDHGE